MISRDCEPEDDEMVNVLFADRAHEDLSSDLWDICMEYAEKHRDNNITIVGIVGILELLKISLLQIKDNAETDNG